MEERRVAIDSSTHDLEIKLARLEEKIAARDQALMLATDTLKAWQSSSNEWRKENIDQRNLFMTIDKAQSLIAAEQSLRAALEARVAVLEQSLSALSGKSTGSAITWAAAATITSITISLIYFILRIIR